jgi:hypothetical protein
MSRIVALSIVMLPLGVPPGLTESNSQGIRVVTARDLLNYAEMPTFREALLDLIRHTENGVSWGMVVGQKTCIARRLINRWRLSKSSRFSLATRKTIRSSWIGIGNW